MITRNQKIVVGGVILGGVLLAAWRAKAANSSNGSTENIKVDVSPGLDTIKPSSIHFAVWNKNFGNIRNAGKRYVWEITPVGNTYKQFGAWEHGAAAFIAHIRRYITGDLNGKYLNTITKIISTWAPDSENDTNNYIQFVVNKTGISANQIISADDKPTIWAITKAMSKMESNDAYPYYTEAVFNTGWNLALNA